MSWEYSDTVLEHFSDPRNMGALDSPDAVGIAGKPGAGNYMVLHFRLSGGRICECGFVTFGCPPAIAAGSMVTEMVKGKTVLEALGITANELEQALGGLPMGKGGCAALAVQALRDAFR